MKVEARVNFGAPFPKERGQNQFTLNIGKNLIDDVNPPLEINLGSDGLVTIFHGGHPIKTQSPRSTYGEWGIPGTINASVPSLDIYNRQNISFTVNIKVSQ